MISHVTWMEDVPGLVFDVPVVRLRRRRHGVPGLRLVRADLLVDRRWEMPSFTLPKTNMDPENG